LHLLHGTVAPAVVVVHELVERERGVGAAEVAVFRAPTIVHAPLAAARGLLLLGEGGPMHSLRCR
jgi:hypothetical protein